MTDQQIKDTIRGFLKSWTAGDMKQALSIFTDDSVWINPQGTFKGLSQIEKYATWVYQGNKPFTITENGVGIIVQGDKALIEHDVSGTLNGMKWVVPANCIWEFKNGKVSNMRTFYDVLSQAQQAAKGMIPRWMVKTVVNASQKGLK
jgi:ketosteroid isomerase-like protein